MISLPIPSSLAPVRYRDISVYDVNLGSVVESLTRGRIKGTAGAHLDPDLYSDALPREVGWKPGFGQIDAAQAHLAGHGVAVGDLFLFFGWFREVEDTNRGWRYRRGAPDLHVLYGWLQVGAVIPVPDDASAVLRTFPWLRQHPHVFTSGGGNTIYVGAERLGLEPGRSTKYPGAGVFTNLRSELVLTENGQRHRSQWLLPSWFHPRAGCRALSYHENSARWMRRNESVRLRTVARGQEFVLHCGEYPEAFPWALGIISKGAIPVT